MSKLDELNANKPTINISTRLDARKLATLVLYWRSQKEFPQSISQLCRLTIEVFTELLVRNGSVDYVSSNMAAFEILENTGMKPKSLNSKNLAEALIKEGFDLTIPSLSIDPLHKQITKNSPVSEDSIDFKVAAEELQKRLEQYSKDENLSIQNLKQNILNPNTIDDLKSSTKKEEQDE